MSRINQLTGSVIARAVAVAAGLLLIPMTLTPTGVQENFACGTEGPDGDCALFLNGTCLLDGELVQHRRIIE